MELAAHLVGVPLAVPVFVEVRLLVVVRVIRPEPEPRDVAEGLEELLELFEPRGEEERVGLAEELREPLVESVRVGLADVVLELLIEDVAVFVWNLLTV